MIKKENLKTMALIGMANAIVNGVAFWVMNTMTNLPPEISNFINLSALFILSLLAIYTFGEVFFRGTQISQFKIGLGAAAATFLAVFTSKLGNYFVPSSQMKIASMNTIGGGTSTLTIPTIPIIVGILITITAYRLYQQQ